MFNHYAFGGVSATRAFALWCSTSASGPTRRVPPPRGSPPRCPSRAFPSSSASSSLFFFYEAFPHSEFRRLWALLWSGPLSLLLWVCVLFCGPLFATGTSSGADGRVSRPRSSTWTYSFFCISSISLFTCMRIACSSSLSSLLNFQVAWSGVRLVSFVWFLFHS